MSSSEELLQTKMMESMLREKAKESRKVRKLMRKEKELREQQLKVKMAQEYSDSVRMVKVGLAEPNGNLNNGELMMAMTKIVPMVATLYTSSPNWLIRDRALEVLREIHAKLGKSVIWKYIGDSGISEEQKRVLKFLLKNE